MTAPGALQGLRVLDLSDEKGQYCTKLMADMGADVIKIEPPSGDPVRRIGPFYHDEKELDKSLYWFVLNTSQRGLTLDITTPRGADLFRRLVATADFVVESFASGTDRPEALDVQMAAWTATQTPQEVVQRLQAVGVASGMVQNARDLARDPQLQQRQHYVTLRHSEMGDSVVDQFGFRLSKTPGGSTHAAPVLGQHNAYVFGELLNMGAAEIAKLQEEGVIA